MRKLSTKTVISNVITMLLPVLLLACVCFYGVSESKIPVQLTLRYNNFDFGLFDGIQKDVDLASKFQIGRDIRVLLSSHLDPFFILATLLPAKVSKFIFYLAYALRLCLASFSMKELLRKQVSFGIVFSCLFGVLYSLSSATLSMASYSNAMNVLVILPWVIYALIEFLKSKYTVKNGLIFGLVFASALLLAGDMSLLYVVPFVFCTLIFLANAISKRMLDSIIGFVCALPYFVIGLLIGGITIVNSFMTHDIPVNVELLKTFEFRITIFDMLTRLLDGKPISSGALSPSLSMSIFVLVLVIAFFINSKIPLRARVSLLIIAVLYHFSYASQAWYRISVLFDSTNIPSDISSNMRFACLSALVIFVAAISLRNIHLLKKTELIGVVASILIVIIISNSSAMNNATNTFSIYFSALATIVTYLLLTNANKLNSKALVAVVLLGVLINLSFILPISSYGSSFDSDSVIFDQEVTRMEYEYPFSELEFFNRNENTYIVLHNFEEDNGTEIERINSVAFGAGVKPMFEEVTMRSFYAGGRIPLIDGMQAEESKGKIESYVDVSLSGIEVVRPLIVFSNHDGTVFLELTHGDVTDEMTYEGPFMKPVEFAGVGRFQAKFLIPRGEISNPNDSYKFYTANPEAVAKFGEKISSFDETFNISSTNDGTELYTVLTGRDYDRCLKVTVNGANVTTSNIYGKLAFPVNPNVDSVVTVKAYDSDLIICFLISLLLVVCSIVVILCLETKRKKNANDKIN